MAGFVRPEPKPARQNRILTPPTGRCEPGRKIRRRAPRSGIDVPSRSSVVSGPAWRGARFSGPVVTWPETSRRAGRSRRERSRIASPFQPRPCEIFLAPGNRPMEDCRRNRSIIGHQHSYAGCFFFRERLPSQRGDRKRQQPNPTHDELPPPTLAESQKGRDDASRLINGCD